MKPDVQRPKDGAALGSWALYYARKGVPVFPLLPGTKVPLTESGFKNATTDVETVIAWWKGTPNANIGAACGHEFDVLDVDDGGEETLQSYDPLDVVAEVKTPTGGSHIYFSPCIVPLKNGVKFAPGLDFRTKGGYVVLPPSIHPNGEPYKWRDGAELNGKPLPEVPRWMRELLKREAEESGTVKRHELPQSITEGSRNDMLYKEACSLRAKNYTVPEIFAALEILNVSRCSPPLENRELSQIVESAGKHSPGPSTPPRLPSGTQRLSSAVPNTPAPKSGPAKRFNLQPLESYAVEDPKYLWEPYLRLSQINLLDAKGGSGKTTFAIAMAVQGSLGILPFGGKCEPFKTIYFGNEDTPGEIRKLYEEMGGRPGCFYPVTEDFRLDAEGFQMVDAAILEVGAKLVVFDSVTYYVAGLIQNPLDGMQIAPYLGRLRDVARKTGACILNIRHFKKGAAQNDVEEMGSGSEQWRNSHRSQLVLRPHPDAKAHPRYGIMVHAKGSLNSPKGEPFGFQFIGGEFSWVPTHEIDLSVFEATRGPKAACTPEVAQDWLRTRLSAGACKSTDVINDAAQAIGASRSVMFDAKSAIGARAVQIGEPGKRGAGSWYWTLEGIGGYNPLEDDE